MIGLRKIILLVIIASAAVQAFALEGTTITLSQAQETFRAGNTAYQQQQYAAAREKYASLVDAGVKSPELFYNLGNACARLNKKGEAVLYLSRARDLDPHDPDVIANLRRVAPPDVLKLLSPSHPVQWLTNRLSLREWMELFFISFLIVGLAGGGYLASQKRPLAMRYLALTFTAAWLLVTIFAARKYYEAYYLQYAVVIEPTASVRSGPADKFAQVDTVPEGQIVKNLGTAEEGWTEVQLTDGRKGYVPSTQIVMI